MTDLWTEASRDHDEEQNNRLQATASVAASAFWPFLAAAKTEREFEHRMGYVQDEMLKALAEVPEHIRLATLEKTREDFKVLSASRKEAAAPALPLLRGFGHDGKHYSRHGYLETGSPVEYWVNDGDGYRQITEDEYEAALSAARANPRNDVYRLPGSTSSRKEASGWIFGVRDVAETGNARTIDGITVEPHTARAILDAVNREPSILDMPFSRVFDAAVGATFASRKEAKDAHGYDWEHGDWALFTNRSGAKGIVRVVNNKSTAWAGGPRDSYVDVAFHQSAWDIGMSMNPPQGTPVERHRLAPLLPGTTPSYREASVSKEASDEVVIDSTTANVGDDVWVFLKGPSGSSSRDGVVTSVDKAGKTVTVKTKSWDGNKTVTISDYSWEDGGSFMTRQGSRKVASDWEKAQYAVWIRQGLTGDPFIFADGMTRGEADALLSRLAPLKPGDAAGVSEYLPSERT